MLGAAPTNQWSTRVRPSSLAGVPPRVAPCVLALIALACAAPAVGQRAELGSAVVVVPAVSQMEISGELVAAQPTTDGWVEATGALRIRVRANHAWQVTMSGLASGAESGDATGVWWRAAVEGALAGDYRALPGGSDAVVASGDRGDFMIRVDYRWVGQAGEPVPPVPVIYTLSDG